MSDNVFVHELGRCDSDSVGGGTRIWAFAHVMAGAMVGRDCNIGNHAFIEAGAELGSGVTVKNGVMVWEGVTVGDGVFLGPGVVFTNDRYPRSARLDVDAVRERAADKARWLEHTEVGQGASLGAGAIIGPGLTIGRYAMVAAGALVTRDVEPFRLVAGHPARSVGWVCRAGYPLRRTERGGVQCRHCDGLIGPETLDAGAGC